MMHVTIIISLLLLTANPLFDQQNDKIITIRKAVAEINNTRGYKVKTLSNDYFTSKNEVADNGQELKGYYQRGTLKKIVFSIGISYGMKTYEFYFSNNKLIFAFQKEDIFPEAKGASGRTLNYEKLVPVFEGRYYFEKGKIFQTISKGQKRFADNTEDILMIVTRLLKDLNGPGG
ncbi:MAG: hypothetical protein NVSMB24_13510 [Mucilaginibacter sp.]